MGLIVPFHDSFVRRNIIDIHKPPQHWGVIKIRKARGQVIHDSRYVALEVMIFEFVPRRYHEVVSLHFYI